MNELINRDEAVRAVEHAFIKLYLETLRTDVNKAGSIKAHREVAHKALLGVELADARYNAYGEWNMLGHTLAGSPIWQCSNCSRVRKGAGRSIYCRDCGSQNMEDI